MNKQYETGYMIVDPKGLWLQATIRDTEIDCKCDFIRMKNYYTKRVYEHTLIDWNDLQELGYSVKKIKIQMVEE